MKFFDKNTFKSLMIFKKIWCSQKWWKKMMRISLKNGDSKYVWELTKYFEETKWLEPKICFRLNICRTKNNVQNIIHYYLVNILN